MSGWRVVDDGLFGGYWIRRGRVSAHGRSGNSTSLGDWVKLSSGFENAQSGRRIYEWQHTSAAAHWRFCASETLAPWPAHCPILAPTNPATSSLAQNTQNNDSEAFRSRATEATLCSPSFRLQLLAEADMFQCNDTSSTTTLR
jgi:hypothetical protein